MDERTKRKDKPAIKLVVKEKTVLSRKRRRARFKREVRGAGVSYGQQGQKGAFGAAPIIKRRRTG